jgi:CubicO group peptidase (beta-lactamase class C family)
VRQVETGLVTFNVVAGDQPHTIAERLRFYRVPGVSVTVVDSGRIDWARGWGAVEAGSGVAVDTLTLFQAASISKPVTAVGALRLVEEGRLELDTDVNLQLPSWQLEEKFPERELATVQKVTLRRLLSHSAGTTVSGFPGYGSADPVPSLLQVLEGAPPANTEAVLVDTVPGSGFRYSGGGYTVVQLLIEELSGDPFADYMRERVLEPVGMTHSTFAQPLTAPLSRRAAAGHSSEGAPLPGRYRTYPEMAAAGLWTTPSDLARFGIELQHAIAGDPDRILAPHLARLLVTPQPGSYGLGFWVEAEGEMTWFTHGGSNAGFQSFFLFGTDGRGAVVMTNGDGGYELATEILRSIGRAYDWPVFLPNEREAVDVGPEVLADYVGTYLADWRGEAEAEAFPIEVALEHGELRATLPTFEWHGRTLRAVSPTRFFFLENSGELEFERDATGAVAAVVLHGLGEPLRATRR